MMTKKHFLFVLALCFIAVPVTLNAQAQHYLPWHAKSQTTLSPVYLVDRIYPSMFGPSTRQNIALSDANPPELLWITGYEAEMKGQNGKVRESQEFMCHSNLDMDRSKHREIFGQTQLKSARLFTLSQGQLALDLPKGFGIPVMSSEHMKLTTQVLNLNPQDRTIPVRHKVTINYVHDKDLKRPMKPLMMMGANGLKLLKGKDGYFETKHANPEKHGPGCLLGEQAGEQVWKDSEDRIFTGHWVVKPGREENHTNITRYMDLKYDTTIHYIAAHLHPFAESAELRDLTTGETLFKSEVQPFKDKVGIKHVDYYSSEEGIPIYKDHEYSIVSHYNNTTDEDQDSMAVLYMYILDKEYKGPLKS